MNPRDGYPPRRLLPILLMVAAVPITVGVAVAVFLALLELNRSYLRWLEDVANRRTSEDIALPPAEVLSSERPHLLPVRRPPYPLEVVHVRKVDRYLKGSKTLV